MQDEYIRSRGFALTLARRAVDDLRRDGFRQLRNYVDVCQALAQKTRYNSFLVRTQQALQQADSLYYALIQSLLDRVDGEHLCTFGINFGVGGVVYGATHLKEEVERTGRQSAWLNTANCASCKLEEAICQAEQAGRYIWVLYAQDVSALQNAVITAQKHPFSAFLLVAIPELIRSAPLIWFAECRNLSIWLLLSAPVMEPVTTETAASLYGHRLLFGFAVLLNEKNAEQAMDPEWLQEMAGWSSFCLYARMPGTGEQVIQQIHSQVEQSRTASAVPLLVFDWDEDLHAINQKISEKAVVGAPVDPELPFPFVR